MPQHQIMTKSLPTILDELEAKIARAEAAALDAEGHAKEAEAYADKAGVEAKAAAKKELDWLHPRITDAQNVADKALAQGKINDKNIDTLMTLGNTLAEEIKKSRGETRQLGVAVVNGLAVYSKFITDHCDFLVGEDEAK